MGTHAGSSTDVELKYQYLSTTATARIFGNAHNYYSNGYLLSTADGTINTKIQSMYGNDWRPTSNESASVIPSTNVIVYKREGVNQYVNGNLYYTDSEKGFSTASDVTLFGAYYSSNFKIASAKVFYFKMWKHNELFSNLIPCVDNNNKPGMYDTVSKTTFYNANSSGVDFNYGKGVWPDLSKNNDYDMSNISDSTWGSNSLNINGNSLTSLGLNYDVSSLEKYSISTGFKLNSNSGDINIINTNDINIHINNNKLMYGDVDSNITLNNNKLYTITLVKKKKYSTNTSGEKTSRTVLEVYVNGDFSKDITEANKTTVEGSNINIDIYNYLVYSKGLSINEDSNNYKLTVERYGS